MIKETFGKKIGMTQIFASNGDLVGVTLVEVEPICVLEKVDYLTKSVARIGISKVIEARIKKVSKPVLGYFAKLGLSPYKYIKEVNIEKDADFSFLTEKPQKEKAPKEEDSKKEAPAPVEESKDSGEPPSEEAVQGVEKELSREIGVDLFSEGDVVNIQSKTKGRGFAGGMKRHGWSGQPGSHGSTMHRRVGSVGACSTPSRIWKGLNMPGHMGNANRTIKNLKIVKIDKDKNLLFVKGSIPGSRGSVVKIKRV
ncbi:MAG: 50S ribosomal protein L3 [Candidatus Omnitrophica bacterium]|nr:50S ribosomal protein L3 [Candidatus Omnitrophota bacterium]